MEKATFDDLIRRQEQREKDKIKLFEIEIKSMGKSLVFKKPTDEQTFDAIGEIEGDKSKIKSAYTKLLYNSCSFLQNTELHEKLGVVDPFDTIDKLFDLVEIIQVGDILIGDFDTDKVSEIKN